MRADEIHELLATPARLAILMTVADGRRWTFTELREETGVADGNLHVQTRRLTEAGWLATLRERRGRRTVTCFELTATGRHGLAAYVARLEAELAGRRSQPAERARRGGELGSTTDASRVW